MDPLVTGQILNAARILHQKLEGIAESLDTITSKLDQIVSREMKSAFDALHAAMITTNTATREQRLAFAENTLLLNTGLKGDLTTFGQPNTDTVACAHFGLCFISYLRDDQPIAARHLLQSFEVAPRLSRETLAPQLYQRLFLPRCRPLIEEYELKIQSLEPVGAKREMTNFAEHLAYWVSLPFGDDLTTVSQEDHDAAISYLGGIHEEAIDKRCQQIARELIV